VFDKKPGYAEVDVVEECKRYLADKIKSGELVIPGGVFYKFAGTYEHQVRSERTLTIIVPLSIAIILLILFLNFRSISTSLLVFSGIVVAWAGGFILIWLYSQGWFLNFPIFGVNMRDLFQVHPINLSVAVWVGFLALFGIATDNGVVMGTYLEQEFSRRRISSIDEIREAVVFAGLRRIRPCLMTVATTVLALIPVITSVGRGSDVMVPMAIPSFGGVLIGIVSVFIVPVSYCLIKEIGLRLKR
jgi:Cu(I)/Ag(I) efflux system membrane protein CusA/SilA